MTKHLFDVFRSTMMDKAGVSRKEALDEFISRMRSDPSYLDALAQDYFERMAAVWTVREDRPSSIAFVRTSVAQDKGDRMSGPRVAAPTLVRRTREEVKERTEAAFAEMKAKVRGIVLLDLVLPSGKALRDSTGAECAKAGGFFTAVAAAIKPTQVVDRHLSENDLQNISQRFYRRKVPA